MCKYFQENVKELSLDYYHTLRRHNYVTPTSYLELILTFKTLLNSKRQEVDTMRSRYLTGLRKLEFAASQVSAAGADRARRGPGRGGCGSHVAGRGVPEGTREDSPRPRVYGRPPPAPHPCPGRSQWGAGRGTALGLASSSASEQLETLGAPGPSVSPSTEKEAITAFASSGA